MKRNSYRLAGQAVLLLAVMALAVSPRVVAGDLEYRFDHLFSGTSPASPTTTWVDALFQDVSPGTVLLAVSNLALSGSESVDELYLNLNPTLNPNSLAFSFIGGTGGFDSPTVSLGVNQFKADGDGKYDILFSFSQGGTAANQFTANESMVCQISGITTLTASDFAYLSLPAGGAGPFYAAAHVQRIGSGSVSGWISATTPNPVPEPESTSLLCLGAALLLGRCLESRRRA